MDGWMDGQTRLMDELIEEWVDGQKAGWMDGWIEQTDGWINRRIDGWMNV